MTPADLKTARHSLGLSTNELAAALSDPDHVKDGIPPVDGRTIRRWEAGDRDIPHAAVIVIKSMLKRARPKGT